MAPELVRAPSREQSMKSLGDSASFLPVEAQGDDETRSISQSKAEIMKVKLWVVVCKIKQSKGVSIPIVVGRSRGNWYDFYGLPGSA